MPASRSRGARREGHRHCPRPARRRVRRRRGPAAPADVPRLAPRRLGSGPSASVGYFADRVELIAAVDLESRDRFSAAVERARPTEGSGLVALQRVCTEIVGLGPVLGLIFADNALVDPDAWEPAAGSGAADTAGSDPIEALVIRGQHDGSIAAELPTGWVVIVFWTSLFAASLTIRGGTATQYEAAALCTRTLAGGIAGAG